MVKHRIRYIPGIFIICALLAGALLPAVTAYAGEQTSDGTPDGYTLTVTADRSTVCAGDELVLTVTLGPVRDFGTMQLAVSLPDGLSYVEGSGRTPDGLKQTLGFDTVVFTEKSLLLTGYASTADFASDSDTVLLTLHCVVTEEPTRPVYVTLDRLEFYSCREKWENHTGQYTVVPAVVTGLHAPAEPGTEPAAETDEPDTRAADTAASTDTMPDVTSADTTSADVTTADAGTDPETGTQAPGGKKTDPETDASSETSGGDKKPSRGCGSALRGTADWTVLSAAALLLTRKKRASRSAG